MDTNRHLLDVVAHLRDGDRVVLSSTGFEIRDRSNFLFFDWLRGRTRLGRVFHTIHDQLSSEGLEINGHPQERLVENLALIRAQVKRMKRHYDRRHGFLFKVFFDQEVDLNYKHLIRQLDFLLAKLAQQELTELHTHVGQVAKELRQKIRGRWQQRRDSLTQRIDQVAAGITQVAAQSRSAPVDQFVAWKDDRGLDEVETLWVDMWKKIEHAIGEGKEISHLIAEETLHSFDSIQPLSVNHHNQILSRLVTWEGVINDERRDLMHSIHEWNQVRRQTLKDLQDQYEKLEDATQRREKLAELARLKDLYVERERACLSFVEEAQAGLGQIADELQDGIRRIGRVLMTDRYLDSKVAA